MIPVCIVDPGCGDGLEKPDPPDPGSNSDPDRLLGDGAVVLIATTIGRKTIETGNCFGLDADKITRDPGSTSRLLATILATESNISASDVAIRFIWTSIA